MKNFRMSWIISDVGLSFVEFYDGSEFSDIQSSLFWGGVHVACRISLRGHHRMFRIVLLSYSIDIIIIGIDSFTASRNKVTVFGVPWERIDEQSEK